MKQLIQKRNGGKSLETHSQAKELQESNHVLEGQLRECFGRVVYSHKTHEKNAEILVKRLRLIQLAQIVLSALITGSFIIRIFGFGIEATVIGVIMSALLLSLNLYIKDQNLSELIQKHKKAAIEIWLIRERYQSLLTDLVMGNYSLDRILTERDVLMTELQSAYRAAPSTSSRAYKKAQQALKHAEDMTFSDEEINAFLPQELKRSE